MNNIKIAPSILSADFSKMGEAITNLVDWQADYIHCDIMDGSFVPNITFGMEMVRAIRPYSNLIIDVHLMILEPEKYIKQFAQNGADIITFHMESTKTSTREVLELIRSCGCKSGLVVNPDIDINTIVPYLDLCDQVVLMGVFPGFGGQMFIDSVLNKISELKSIIDNKGYDIDIELDGGVTESNVDELIKRGVSVVVAGSSVFKSNSPKDTIKRLRGVQ